MGNYPGAPGLQQSRRSNPSSKPLPVSAQAMGLVVSGDLRDSPSGMDILDGSVGECVASPRGVGIRARVRSGPGSATVNKTFLEVSLEGNSFAGVGSGLVPSLAVVHDGRSVLLVEVVHSKPGLSDGILAKRGNPVGSVGCAVSFLGSAGLVELNCVRMDGGRGESGERESDHKQHHN